MSIRSVLLLIGVGGITSTYLGAGSVTHTALANDAVEAGNIKDGEVGADEIAADAIGDSELNTAANFNFTGTLQKDGQNLSAGGIYYVVVDALVDANINPAAAPNATDGYTIVAPNKKLLLINQTPGSDCGIFNVDTVGSGADGVWARPTDRDEDTEVPNGVLVYVKNGTTYGGTLWKHVSGTIAGGQVWEQILEGMTPVGSGEAVNVGSAGDGSNLRFDFAVPNVIYAAVFVDGIQQDSSIYHIGATSGGGGNSEIVFESGNAPASGQVVSCIAFTR